MPKKTGFLELFLSYDITGIPLLDFPAIHYASSIRRMSCLKVQCGIGDIEFVLGIGIIIVRINRAFIGEYTCKISSSNKDSKVPPATNINLDFKVLDGGILKNSSKLIGRPKTGFIVILGPVAVILYEILVLK